MTTLTVAPGLLATVHTCVIDVCTIPELWTETIKLPCALTGSRTDNVTSSTSLVFDPLVFVI